MYGAGYLLKAARRAWEGAIDSVNHTPKEFRIDLLDVLSGFVAKVSAKEIRLCDLELVARYDTIVSGGGSTKEGRYGH